MKVREFCNFVIESYKTPSGIYRRFYKKTPHGLLFDFDMYMEA